MNSTCEPGAALGTTGPTEENRRRRQRGEGWGWLRGVRPAPSMGSSLLSWAPTTRSRRGRTVRSAPIGSRSRRNRFSSVPSSVREPLAIVTGFPRRSGDRQRWPVPDGPCRDSPTVPRGTRSPEETVPFLLRESHRAQRPSCESSARVAFQCPDSTVRRSWPSQSQQEGCRLAAPADGEADHPPLASRHRTPPDRAQGAAPRLAGSHPNALVGRPAERRRRWAGEVGRLPRGRAPGRRPEHSSPAWAAPEVLRAIDAPLTDSRETR